MLKKIAIDLAHGKLPKSASDDLTKARINMCHECEHFSKIMDQCKLCGCFINLKAKVLEASCPIEKW